MADRTVERRRRNDWALRWIVPFALIVLLPSLVGLKVLGDQSDKLRKQAVTLKTQQTTIKRQQRELKMQQDVQRRQQVAVEEQAKRNAAALAFICSTTGIVDSLIVAAGNQTKKNFQTGAYSRLLKQGLITQDNIDAARRSLNRYDAYHRVLSGPSPCSSFKTRLPTKKKGSG